MKRSSRQVAGRVALITCLALIGAACGGGSAGVSFGGDDSTGGDDTPGVAEPAGGSSDGTSKPDDPSAAPTTDGADLNASDPLEIKQDGVVVSDPEGRVSGTITTPGEQLVYTFEVSDDEYVVFSEAGACSISGGDSLGYDLKGPIDSDSDFAEADDGVNCNNTWDFETDESGTVQVTIGSMVTSFSGDEAAFGDFSFKVTRVNLPEPMAIQFDQVIGPDSPFPGAGRIEVPGQKDYYTVELKAGSSYALVGQGGCKIENGDDFEVELNGVEYSRGPGSFSSVLELEEQSSEGDCTKTVSFVATETGTMIIEVEDSVQEATGVYSFVIREEVGG